MDRSYHQVYDCDRLFYYFFAEEESCSLVLRLALVNRIDRKILKSALIRTLDRFPNFRQTPVLDQKGYLHTRDNDKEPEIYAYDPDLVNLGTGACNGYLFRVMTEGNRLWISVFHGVCDGRGYMLFIRTLLYWYYTLAGYPIRENGDKILTDAVPVDPSEMADPFESIPDVTPGVNPLKPDQGGDFFHIPDRVKGSDPLRSDGIFRYVLDAKRLVALAHEAGTTVDNYFHLLTARTIHESYDTGDQLIAGMGAVDLRPYYDSRYLQNMRELFWVYYTGQLLSHTDREVAEFISREFKAPQLCKENYDRVQAASKASIKEMLGFPLSLKEGRSLLRQHFGAAPEMDVTYFTTNLGRFDLGEDLDRFVVRADIYGPDIFRCPCMLLLTQGDETTVNLSQRSMSRYFPLRLKEAFQEKGLLNSAEMGCMHQSDRLCIDQLAVEL